MNEAQHLIEWQKRFNEFCYHLFYKDKTGAAFLKHIEDRFFRSPVAIPGQDIGWTYLNEGRNEFIRSVTAGIQAHMNQENKKDTQEIKRSIA